MDKLRKDLSLIKEVNGLIEVDPVEIDCLAATKLDEIIHKLSADTHRDQLKVLLKPGIDPMFLAKTHLIERLIELQCSMLAGMAARKKSTGKLKA